jgi:hypothetical protein
MNWIVLVEKAESRILNFRIRPLPRDNQQLKTGVERIPETPRGFNQIPLGKWTVLDVNIGVMNHPLLENF